MGSPIGWRPVQAAGARHLDPVAHFSPGFGAQPAFYSALLTELASQGYIIAVITHTYSIPVTRFPNGDLIMANGGR
ncbi:MAG: hypothetical protein IPK17_32200 [Chloroflexi bacterium]|nr:hypothetical protein [Chloroflexota bacterium]